MWWSVAKLVLIAALLAKLINFIVFLMFLFVPFSTVYKHHPGDCHIVPGIVNGSENMAMTSDGLVLMTSGYVDVRQVHEPYRGRQGAVFIYDMTDRSPQQPAIKMKIEPPFREDEFLTHGMDLRLIDGRYELLVVNHGGGGESVERFAADLRTRTLTRVSSVISDEFGNLNDVAWVSDTEFLYTNGLWSTPQSLFNHIEPFVADWGNLGICNVRTGTCRIAAKNLGLANGVTVSTNGRFIYVVKGMDKVMLVFERTEAGLEERQRYDTGASVLDNLHLTSDDSTLFSGAHPVPLAVLPLMADHNYKAPLQVLKFGINRETGLIKSMEQVLADPAYSDGKVYGSSAAILRDGRLLVGTVATGALVCNCPSC